MPVTKSAKKKLGQDAKRTVRNRFYKRKIKEFLKAFYRKPTAENLKKAQSIIDKAARKNIIHKNKAARLKEKIAKFLPKKVKAKVKKESKVKAKRGKGSKKT